MITSGVATWNQVLDGEFVFKTLLAPYRRYRVAETAAANLSTWIGRCGGDGRVAETGGGDGAPRRRCRCDSRVTEARGGDLQLRNVST